ALAVPALPAPRDLQSHVDDPNRDAEPGKIVHEVRHGKAARVWHPAYYGTADATALYLILLSEVWGGRTTTRLSKASATARCRRSTGWRSAATWTATGSSRTSSGAGTGSTTRRGRART